MDDRFIEDTLDDFFKTGILKCSMYQLIAIYNYVKEQVSKNKDNSEEQQRWMALSKMLFIYLNETKGCVTTANENLKVDFKEYLNKVYGVGIGELPSDNREYLYERYISFITENCCDKCLDMLSPQVCKECKCGEVWNRILY